MSLLQSRDLDDAARTLGPWLSERLPGARELRIEGMSAPPSTGFSNETLLFDARWTESGEERSQGLVARVKATRFQVFPEYDIERQYRVLEILGETKVPVPRVYGFEPDARHLGAPFFVMERIEGEIPPDAPTYHMAGWLTEARPEERERLWWSGVETMAKVHRLDWRRLRLEFLEPQGSGATPLERQLDYYGGFLEWVAAGRPQPVVERALAWLVRHRPREAEPVAFCWGDSRLGNMIFRSFRCVAVLDWEMAVLANPEQDLAWWLFFDRHHSEGCEAPRLEGFPSREDTIERYREWTGHPPRHLEYYEVFAAFRFGVIMIRVGQHLVQAGFLAEDSDVETNNTVTRMLARMLDLPPP
ncbi:MAG: phosphotransferase family protein [Candidatus Binatia bacterium]